ncbi:MAG: beta-propeller fold lactonase family protein, partial [Gemmatimonadetes bacterium]|nr:beta-propeller fold lactonase family protein [Gemmatimonadota bacterium]
SEHDFGRDITPALVADPSRKVYGYRFDGYWRDVGTIESYFQSNMDLLDDVPDLDMYDSESRISTRFAGYPPAKIGRQAEISRSLLELGCIINGRIEHSVLSPGVYVEEGAVVRDSIIFDDTRIDAGAPSATGEIPFADAQHLLYVANQSAALISVIDMESNQVIRTVDLQQYGLPPNASPHHIAVEPDGSHWYVSAIAANQILKFDRDNELVDRIDFVRPGLLALDPEGENLYVGRSMAAVSPPQAIGVIRRSDMTLEEVGVFLPRPHAMAVRPGTGTVYIASLAVNQIASFYPDDETVELDELEGDRQHTLVEFAVSPDGRWMVGTTELTATVFVFDLDLAPAMTPVDTIMVNASPWHPVFTPDGRWVYVGNNRGNTVNVIDMETRTLAKVIEGNGLAQPHGAAVSPDGRFAYISSRNLEMSEDQSRAGHVYTPRYDLGDNARAGTVVVIDTESQEIVKVIEIEGYGAGLGVAARH